MRPAFHCILNSDLITTRDNCATWCKNDSCENKDKAIKECEKINNVLRNYSIDEINSDDPPEEIKKLIEEIRENCETGSKDILEGVETIRDMYPSIGGFAPGEYLCKCHICGDEFTGDKRAVECKHCAISGNS